VTEFGVATGVHLHSHHHHDETIHARKEVILAAGAIGSPQLLQMSGIGPADVLRAADVEVKVDAPEVGANLQDHPYLTLIWEATGESLHGADSPRRLAEWLLRRSGPLTTTVAEAFLFTRSSDDKPAPDLQFHFAPGYFNDNGEDEFDGHAFTFGPVLVAPRARGEVTLRSIDPHEKPRIITNSLSDDADVAALVEGARIARRIALEQPIAEMAVREILPGPDAQSDEAIVADLRRRVQLLYHPVGTCRMGADSNSVVDEELRVREIENLRVVDASVMPTITRGNTNAPTIMIAERAADLIRGRVSSAAGRADREPVAQ
jgi:choline dehydrogenase-like flavoprotein